MVFLFTPVTDDAGRTVRRHHAIKVKDLDTEGGPG